LSRAQKRPFEGIRQQTGKVLPSQFVVAALHRPQALDELHFIVAARTAAAMPYLDRAQR